MSGYNYTQSLPYLTATTSWNYNYGNPNSIYAQNISGTQQLSNRNVLFCNGPEGIFSEENSSGTVVWQYIDPVTTSGILKQTEVATQNIVFTSTFYPKTYSGFVGYTLTSGTTIEDVNSISAACK